MMLIVLIFCLFLITPDFVLCQYPELVSKGRVFIPPDSDLKNCITKQHGLSRLDSLMLIIIKKVDQQYSIKELSSLVNYCVMNCYKSDNISISLTNWLREDHSIYTNKSPTDVNQFRGFLIYSLSKFNPNDILYEYIKYELQFSNHVFNIAAAAHTARNFKSKSPELIELMKPYLSNLFQDEWVDITTIDLNYPLLQATKARYEIIQTLIEYGAASYSSIKLLDELINSNNKFSRRDSILLEKSIFASKYIREVTPICCQRESEVKTSDKKIKIFSKKNRTIISTESMVLFDQDENLFQFSDLKGSPFVLTFFYTRCDNPTKCASTVSRLGKLQKELINQNMDENVVICGMTFDPDFDKPSILKSYGKVYGIKFSENMKFLLEVEKSAEKFSKQLQLRVNYGYGIINQHGIQLFIFDKNGELAAISDNEQWSINQVKNCLIRLIEE